MNRRDFLKTGAGALAATAVTGAARAAAKEGTKGVIDIDSPLSVVVMADGKWRTAKGDEVSVSDGRIRLKTDRAAWVRLTWAAKFGADARVLPDAWERTYGKHCWQPIATPWFSPWYFSVRDGGRTRCVGVKVQPSALCSWTGDCSSVTLTMDVRCGCQDTLFGGRELVLCELVQLEQAGDPWDAMHAFCKLMCPNPVLPREPVFGGDDWYAFYSNNSFKGIVEHAKKLSACSEGLANRPFQMVDAGWQLCHNWYPGDEYIGGPYRYCNSKFKDMKALASAVRDVGARPGVWCRPQETVEYVSKEAFLNRIKNVKYLDPSHPEAREILDSDLRRFIDWGYELVKWDFLEVDTFRRYAIDVRESIPADGDWTFYDRTRTSAEICLEYYRGTAKIAKDVYVNTCNTLSHLTAGLFPGFRIGDDTSGNDWKRTVGMGVNTMAFRGFQDRAFYLADCDCVGITDKIPWERNREWLRLLQYSGTPVAVSIQDEMFTSEVRDAVTEAFHLAAVPHPTARALDWDETLTPRRWQTFDGVKEFNWE